MEESAPRTRLALIHTIGSRRGHIPGLRNDEIQ